MGKSVSSSWEHKTEDTRFPSSVVCCTAWGVIQVSAGNITRVAPPIRIKKQPPSQTSHHLLLWAESWQLSLTIIIVLVFVGVCLNICLCTACLPGAQGGGMHGTGATDGCDPWYRCINSNLGPPDEQLALLTTKLSLLPWASLFKPTHVCSSSPQYCD